jgi:hypothetical protein
MARLHLPDDALPGSLSVSRRRCGKPSCHCAKGDGHPFATLTFMLAGKKRVEAVTADWLDPIRPRVDAGRKLKAITAELLVVNAQLFVLARQQRHQTAHPPAVPWNRRHAETAPTAGTGKPTRTARRGRSPALPVAGA